MDLEKRTELPNSLEEHWMPFTSNRDYKNSPRLMVKAEGVLLAVIEAKEINLINPILIGKKQLAINPQHLW